MDKQEYALKTKDICLKENMGSHMSEVSVLIPFKDNDPYLQQCVDSVICQTFPDIQIVCIDCGSNDDSMSIIQEFLDADERIKVIPAASLERLTKEITGKYILFLDSGDYLEPTALERLYKKAKAAGSDLTYCSFSSCDEYLIRDVKSTDSFSKDKIPQNHLFSLSDCRENIFDLLPEASGCFLYKKSFLDENGFNFLKNIPCFFLMFQTAIKASKIAYLDADLLHHRINYNTKKIIDDGCKDLLNQFDELCLFLKQNNYDEQLKISLVHKFLNILQGIYQNLSEPLSSLFALDIIYDVFPKFSDNINVVKKHPLNSLLSRYNLLPEFKKVWNNSPKTIVPIVIPAFDRGAAFNASVIIKSITAHANQRCFYDVYILCLNDLDVGIKNRLERFSQGKVRVSCVEIDKYLPTFFAEDMSDISDIHMFLLDKIFTFYSKILYLAPQNLVQKDLFDFFNADMDGKALAGVMAYDEIGYIEKDLGLTYETFINTDALLIDLDIFRKENLFQQCLDLVLVPLNQYRFPIRDILNYVCQNSIQVLDNKYLGQRPFILGKPLIEGYSCNSEDFYIINYTDEKPWIHPELELMDLWWSVAQKSSFYEAILQNNNKTQTTISKEETKDPLPQQTAETLSKEVAPGQKIVRSKDGLYPLLGAYIKEAFGVCFSFGGKKRKHGNKLKEIEQEIIQSLRQQ